MDLAAKPPFLQDRFLQGRPNQDRPTQDRPNAARWMTLAFIVAALCAVAVLAAVGTGERGTDDALQATGRVSFLLFWPAYVGGALVTLFGPAFQPVRRRGREFGLAFASAQTVHMGLVAWLCWIGATPVMGVFVFFGIALICMYLLALCSIAGVRRAVGPIGWRILQVFGMNYIAYAFATDFLKFQHDGTVKFALAYLPFAALSLVGPALVLAALAMRTARARWPGGPALLARPRRHPAPR